MIKLIFQVLLIIFIVANHYAQSDVIQKTQKIINEVIEKSYPELKYKI